MHTVRRSVLAALLTTALCAAGLIAGAAPASAEDSTFCPQAGSTRVLTANDGYYKVWVYTLNGWTHVCFREGYDLGGDLMIQTGVPDGLVPTVTPPVDPNCDRSFELQDPAHFLLQLELGIFSNPITICLGAEGTAVRVTLSTPSPTVNPGIQLWLDPGSVSTFTSIYCAVLLTDCSDYPYPMRVL